MGNPKKSKKYYAVIEGHIDKPTIFSSWADAHPRVTGCPSKYRGFYTIHEARIYMELMGVDYIEQLIDDGTDETAPLPDPRNYYAVANGPKPGIYAFWDGPGGAKEAVELVSFACHKSFRTYKEAQEFIDHWNNTYMDGSQKIQSMGPTFETRSDNCQAVFRGQMSLCESLEALIIKEEHE
ncbi:hypothetical protein FocnCong_v013161 [Fusarium oxysporum f. sp. conglutinans]|nr:hypothetical protein FocnCong_v013161 [Fusarium oxysporum f. sp. conglutinans]